MNLDTDQYIYEFDDILSTPSKIRVISPHSASSTNAKVAINDEHFLYRRLSYMDSLLADLVDIGVAVYVADRLSGQHHKGHRRSLHLCLPVRCPEIFECSKVNDLLCETLHYFSHDEWTFTFSQRQRMGRQAELQLSMEEPRQPVEVALWSGGLDSLAGLYQRLHASSAPAYTLFSATSNRMIQGVQKRVANSVAHNFRHQTVKLEQIKFAVTDVEGFQQNRVPRTRGFLFLLLGAVCACLEGQQILHVYENGVGAINLPYLKSSTGLDHSRAVNPIAMCYMSNLVSTILDVPFRFYNPFLFHTKAQICAPLVNHEKFCLIRSTITCDRRRRSKNIQCGRCSSCLLRRQALLVSGMEELNYAILVERCNGVPVKTEDGDYLRAMLHQVDKLRKCLKTTNPWDALALEYVDLPSVAWWLADTNQGEQKTVEQQLVTLYQLYVSEWEILDVRQKLSDGLLFDEEIS